MIDGHALGYRPSVPENEEQVVYVELVGLPSGELDVDLTIALVVQSALPEDASVGLGVYQSCQSDCQSFLLDRIFEAVAKPVEDQFAFLGT